MASSKWTRHVSRSSTTNFVSECRGEGGKRNGGGEVVSSRNKSCPHSSTSAQASFLNNCWTINITPSCHNDTDYTVSVETLHTCPNYSLSKYFFPPFCPRTTQDKDKGEETFYDVTKILHLLFQEMQIYGLCNEFINE